MTRKRGKPKTKAKSASIVSVDTPRNQTTDIEQTVRARIRERNWRLVDYLHHFGIYFVIIFSIMGVDYLLFEAVLFFLSLSGDYPYIKFVLTTLQIASAISTLIVGGTRLVFSTYGQWKLERDLQKLGDWT